MRSLQKKKIGTAIAFLTFRLFYLRFIVGASGRVYRIPDAANIIESLRSAFPTRQGYYLLVVVNVISQ